MFIHPVCNSLHLLIPNLQSIPPPHSAPPAPPSLAITSPFSVGPVIFIPAFGFGTQTAMVPGDAVLLLPGKLQPTSLHGSLPCRPGQEWTAATRDSWESSTASVRTAPAYHFVSTPGARGEGHSPLISFGGCWEGSGGPEPSSLRSRGTERGPQVPSWSCQDGAPCGGRGVGEREEGRRPSGSNSAGLGGSLGREKRPLSPPSIQRTLDSRSLSSARPAPPRGRSPLQPRIRQRERISRYTERKSPWGASCGFAFRRVLNENRRQAHLYPCLWPTALGSAAQGDCLPQPLHSPHSWVRLPRFSPRPGSSFCTPSAFSFPCMSPLRPPDVHLPRARG